LKDLADIHFAHAKTIVLVQDNLSIHSKASLYEAFPAVEARRLVERFEWLDSISTKTASIGLQDVPRNCFAHVLMQSAALGDLGYANLGV
jgi:hypothetical protein